MRLPFPERVTPHNLDMCRALLKRRQMKRCKADGDAMPGRQGLQECMCRSGSKRPGAVAVQD